MSKLNELEDSTIVCITNHPGYSSLFAWIIGYSRQRIISTDNTMVYWECLHLCM